MNTNRLRFFSRFARFGILGRDEVKNDLAALHGFIRKGLVRKALRQGRVFYELTEKALPLLEQRRRVLLEELRLRSLLNPRLVSLIEDVRFLDERSPEADEFVFLGDWQLSRPVIPAQLELAKLRFYQNSVPRRTRRRKAA